MSQQYQPMMGQQFQQPMMGQPMPMMMQQQQGMSAGAKIVIGFVVVAIVVILLYLIAGSSDTPSSSSNTEAKSNVTVTDKDPSHPVGSIIPAATGLQSPTNPIVLERVDKITDCGFDDLKRGWYDVQGQGRKNDFCRYVGDRPDANGNGGWFSCMLAGTSDAYTPMARVINPNSPYEPYVAGTHGC